VKINAKFTLSVPSEEDKPVRLRIEDDDARVTFIELSIEPKVFVQALGSLGSCPCDCEVRGLNKLGLKHECKSFQFQMPDKDMEYRQREKVAYRLANKLCPEGWEPDNYFGSQGSFFYQDGELWAKVIIRRWVPQNAKT